MTDKRIYQIGLTMINGVGDILARHLLQALGEAEAVFTEKQQLLGRIPGTAAILLPEIQTPGNHLATGGKKSWLLREKQYFLLLSD